MSEQKKEFYIVGRWDTDYQGEPKLLTYSYNNVPVISSRESADLTVEMCNDKWPANQHQSEWRLFKIVEAE